MNQVLTYAAQPFELLTQTVTSYTSFECEWYVMEFNTIFVVLKVCEVLFNIFYSSSSNKFPCNKFIMETNHLSQDKY